MYVLLEYTRYFKNFPSSINSDGMQVMLFHQGSWGICPMPLIRQFHNSASSASPPFVLHEITAPVANPSYRCGRFIFAGILERYEGLYAGLFNLGFGIRCIVCERASCRGRGGPRLCQSGGRISEFSFRAFSTTSITTEIC